LDFSYDRSVDRATEHLRVLIANERKDRLALVAAIVVALGHEVIAREIDVEDVGPVTARERPDVALVGLGASSEHALELIDKIVRQAACPVIVLLHAPDPAFVKEASKRGVFAHISDSDVEDWQGSIDIVLRRFAEFHDLQGAFGRRALTERAKGILMERHSISEDSAFEMLRDQSRVTNRNLIDLAGGVVDGHPLLSSTTRFPAASSSNATAGSGERAEGTSLSHGRAITRRASYCPSGLQPVAIAAMMQGTDLLLGLTMITLADEQFVRLCRVARAGGGGFGWLGRRPRRWPGQRVGLEPDPVGAWPGPALLFCQAELGRLWRSVARNSSWVFDLV
jgi:AmiR/NasT family two-component response regulator